jgi:tetratricopeptide (TPR) repeat protein
MVEREKGVAELEGLTRSGNDEVAARARFALAQAREADKRYDEALAIYNELLKDKNPIVPADTVNFRIAAVKEQQGNKDEAAEILFRMVEEARKAKDKDDKPVPLSTTAREASTKLEALNPERYAQLPPEPTTGSGNSIQNMPF